jgi:hypothetical protein
MTIPMAIENPLCDWRSGLLKWLFTSGSSCVVRDGTGGVGDGTGGVGDGTGRCSSSFGSRTN